jgi:glycosyltransferase involved in cell wall biosynthesis
VLPTFNRLRYLRQAVDSVLAQSLVEWELIIADDGSDAETRGYLAALQSSPRIRAVWLSHTGNCSAVRNAGLREARGAYVAFLDSDDLWAPGKLQAQVSALRAATTRRWSYTRCSGIDELGREATFPVGKPWIPYRGDISVPLLTLRAAVATSSVLVERRLLNQVGGFDERQAILEDYELFLRLAAHSEVELIDEPLTYFRLHPQQLHKEGIRMLTSRRRLLRKSLDVTSRADLRAVAGRLYAETTLALASVHAGTDRVMALKTLASGWARSRGHVELWLGMPRLLLKLTVPRGLLAIARRSRMRQVWRR